MPLNIIEVENVDDPALDVYRHLKDRQLKFRRGLFIAEGELVVRRLLHSDFRAHSLLLTRTRFAALRADIPDGLPVYLTTVEQTREIAGFEIHRGAVGCGYRREPLTLDAAVEAARRRGRSRMLVAIAQNVCDVQNIGLIVRSAAAFDAALVVLGDGCTDPFYRRVVRVSMGNVLRLPVYETDDLSRDLPLLREQLGLSLVAAELSDAATPLTEANRPRRVGVLFGSEGAGLTAPVLELCDQRVVIPMNPGSDSVNVGVASGIFLYAYSRGT